MWNNLIKRFKENKKIGIRKNKKKRNKNVCETICVLGIGHGVGTTHFAIALGNYFANGCGKKVIIMYTKEMEYEFQRTSNIEFKRVRADLDLTENMDNQYDVIIIDTSWDNLIGRKEFYRSNKKIVVGSLSEWKIGAYQQFLSEVSGRIDVTNCAHLSLTENRRKQKELEAKYKIKFQLIPFIPNPFCFKAFHLQWFVEKM